VKKQTVTTVSQAKINDSAPVVSREELSSPLLIWHEPAPPGLSKIPEALILVSILSVSELKLIFVDGIDF
jgi:hypothetical protein